MSFKLLTGRENNQLTEYQDFLIHQDSKESFIKLQKAAQNEIGADLKIISSFRNYERQLLGWNLKASGKRDLYDEDDNLVNFDDLNPEQLLFAILKWSAVPGASRHHWGSDFDIYDANKIKKEDVKLLPSECSPDGPCGELHQWLDQKIKENKSFNFFRPYETLRGGVAQEKWHISFAAVSQSYNEAYSLDIFIQNIEQSDLLLKSELLQNVELIYEKYVKNIDSPPF